MDGLRGIAMLFVFMGHFSSVWEQLAPPSGAAHLFLRVVDADATLGSSLFMLLSGFFGYGSLRRGRNFGAFLKGRLLRLYPLYFLMVSLYLVGCFVVPSLSKLPSDPSAAALFILENLMLLPGVFHMKLLLEVSWTLSFVLLFYFIEGVMVWAFRALGTARVWRFCVLSAGAVIWAWVGDHTLSWEPRTAVFWTGMALLEAVEWASTRGTKFGAALLFLASVLFPACIVLRTELMIRHASVANISLPLWTFAVTSVALSSLVWTARFGPGWWKQQLSSNWLRSLGAASYSFYLTHGFTLKAFRFGIIPWLGAAASHPVIFWVSQVLGLTMSVFVARVIFVAVESPISSLAMATNKPPGERRGEATPA